MKKITSIAALMVLTLTVIAQKDVKFTINHLLGTTPFAFNTSMSNDMGDVLKLTRLEYYISDISIIHDGGQISAASSVYILANANVNDTIFLGNFNITNVEAIKFSVGVDPGVNNGDPSGWGIFHPLAPKNPSMHWGWAAGYRFVALEGNSGMGFAQDFQIHALGNRNYFKQILATGATNENNALLISINADYSKAVSGIAMAAGLIEHGETGEAPVCLRNFQTKVFTNTSGQGSIANVSQIDVNNAVTISPVPSSGQISFAANDASFSNADYSVSDVLGKVIVTGNLATNSPISVAEKGLYFITFKTGSLTSTERFIIQ